MNALVVITPEELRALIREEVRAAIPQMQAPSRWKWIGPAKGPRQFGISPQAWAALLDSGKLPHTTRPCRGGGTARFVREIDAERYFTPRAASA